MLFCYTIEHFSQNHSIGRVANMRNVGYLHVRLEVQYQYAIYSKVDWSIIH